MEPWWDVWHSHVGCRCHFVRAENSCYSSLDSQQMTASLGGDPDSPRLRKRTLEGGCRAVQEYACASWAAAGDEEGRLRCSRQKWVMQEHLKGLLWNSKNSFAGNWISNDTKWKWSCESVLLLREPHFLQPHWDSEATREGSKGMAYGNEWRHAKITFHCALLNFMGAWWGPGLSDMMPVVYSVEECVGSSFPYIFHIELVGHSSNSPG